MNYQQLYHGLGGDIKNACYKGLIRGVKKVQRNAKYLCPVRKPNKGKSKTKSGGQLRNSIKTKSQVTIDGVEAQVYTNCEYAPYVEFGTGKRGRESTIDKPEGISYNAKWKGQSPQPFLFPAFQHAKNTGEVEQELIKSVQQDIRKLGGR